MKRLIIIFVMATCILSACDSTVSINMPGISPSATLAPPMQTLPSDMVETPTFVLPIETPTSVPSQVPTTGRGSAVLSLDILRYAVYHSPDWGEFQLSDGIYYRTPPSSQESPETYATQLQDPVVYGDLNADGLEDAIVFLNTQNGGTGHFIEMAAMLNLNGSALNISTVSLGDRIGIESVIIQDGVVTLNLVVQGPNDPLAAASQPETWEFRLENDQLIRLNS